MTNSRYHIVFVDIVSFSKRDTMLGRLVDDFSQLIRNTTYRLDQQTLVLLPTGDGCAICYPDSQNCSPVELIADLSRLLSIHNEHQLDTNEKYTEFIGQWYSDRNTAFALRIGVSHGYLASFTDARGHPNLAGGALNDAARYMYLAGPMQAVFSPDAKHMVDVFRERSEFVDLPVKTVKETSYRGYRLSGIEHLDRTPPRIEHQPDVQTHIPSLWMRTAHSRPEVPFEPASIEDRRKIAGLVRDHLRDYIGRPDQFEKLTHVMGTDVFRVSGREGEVLLKRYRKIQNIDWLKWLTQTQEAVGTADIFAEGRAIVPLPVGVVDPATNRPVCWIDQEEGGQVLAFPFVTDSRSGAVTHFSGIKRAAIFETAAKLAGVNEILSSLPPPPSRLREQTIDSEIKQLESFLSSEAPPSTRLTYLLHAEAPFLSRQIHGVLQLHPPAEIPMSHEDCHPHNVFIREVDGACALIFDYERATTDWPVAATVGLAMHRLVREYVARRAGRTDSRTIDALIADGAKEFIAGYGEVDRNLADMLRGIGVLWAGKMHLAKLGRLLSYAGDKDADRLGRDDADYFDEAVKFVCYLRELEAFRRILADG